MADVPPVESAPPGSPHGRAEVTAGREGVERVGWGFIVLYTLAYAGAALLLLAPLLVSLALKVNSLVGIERAPTAFASSAA